MTGVQTCALPISSFRMDINEAAAFFQEIDEENDEVVGLRLCEGKNSDVGTIQHGLDEETKLCAKARAAGTRIATVENVDLRSEAMDDICEYIGAGFEARERLMTVCKAWKETRDAELVNKLKSLTQEVTVALSQVTLSDHTAHLFKRVLMQALNLHAKSEAHMNLKTCGKRMFDQNSKTTTLKIGRASYRERV